MYRRHLLIAGGMGLAIPFALYAQKKPARIGVLTSTTLTESFKKALLRGFQELGYVEGRDVLIEWKSADGRVDRAAVLARELVAMQVDVIVAERTPAAQAARKATSTIPIVMAYVGEPVRIGLVKSLAQPGGNVTGMSANSADTSGKRISLLRDLVPKLVRLGLLINSADGFAKPFVEENQAATKRLGMELRVFDVGQQQEFESTFAEISKLRLGAVVVQGVLMSQARKIADAAVKHKVPTVCPQKQFVVAGGLMSYGPDFNDQVRRSVGYVDKILKGAKPGELPVQEPVKFELALSIRTAKRLGLTVSKDFLATVDELIQ